MREGAKKWYQGTCQWHVYLIVYIVHLCIDIKIGLFIVSTDHVY